MDWILPHTGRILAEERVTWGCNFAVTLLTGEKGRFVLKRPGAAERSAALTEELGRESRVLEALQAYRPFVATPIAHQGDAFLFSYVEGENFLEAIDQADEAGRHRLIADLALTLRQIHSWQPPLPAVAAEGCLPGVLARAEALSEIPAEELPEMRQWARSVKAQVVFDHGDPSLPNFLVSGGRISGVIDWSLGGYTDRRFDLAIAVRSTRWNLKDEAYVATLLDAYGFTEPAEVLAPFERLWRLV